MQKQRRIAEITKQLDSMLIKYASPENKDGGLISDEEYKTAKTRLQKEKFALEGEITTRDEKMDELLELSTETFKFARYARIRFKQGDEKTKRAIFLSLGSNFVFNDRTVSLDLYFPLKGITEKKQMVEDELNQVRTFDYLINTRQIFNFADKIPILRGVVEDVRTFYLEKCIEGNPKHGG